MQNDRWKPNVTVATLVEKDNKYLMVHETPNGNEVYNQPAGHLDKNESIITAAKRETLEETAWEVEITHHLGLYRHIADNDITYLRNGFLAKPIRHHPIMSLDNGIIQALWMTYEDIIKQENLRGPLVKRLLDNYRACKLYTLDMLYALDLFFLDFNTLFSKKPYLAKLFEICILSQNKLTFLRRLTFNNTIFNTNSLKITVPLILHYSVLAK